MLLYGQLKEGHRDQGIPFKRYKDTLKANFKSCSIDVNSWEATARDRALWRYQCTQGTKDFEVNRAAAIQETALRYCGFIPMQHLWPLVCVTNWSSFPHEDPPRQMTCLPSHLSYRQDNPSSTRKGGLITLLILLTSKLKSVLKFANKDLGKLFRGIWSG